MVNGRLDYCVELNNKRDDAAGVRSLRLSLIVDNDEYILSSQGLSELRKERIIRLSNEAEQQGMSLSYQDLNMLLLSSVATLKRDINILEEQGYAIHLKGRKRKRALASGGSM